MTVGFSFGRLISYFRYDRKHPFVMTRESPLGVSAFCFLQLNKLKKKSDLLYALVNQNASKFE